MVWRRITKLLLKDINQQVKPNVRVYKSNGFSFKLILYSQLETLLLLNAIIVFCYIWHSYGCLASLLLKKIKL